MQLCGVWKIFYTTRRISWPLFGRSSAFACAGRARATVTRAPNVAIRSAARSAIGQGRWRVRWTIENADDQELRLLSARMPHDEFFAPEVGLDKRVPSGATAELELEVACEEPPGATVENAFLILHVGRNDKSWRILARLRVTVDAKGVPVDTCQLITTHPIGFARGGD